MGWTVWLLLGVSLISLYVLALMIYRVFLSAKGLKAQIELSQSLISSAQEFEELLVTPATPSKREELGTLQLNRRRFVRAREKRAQDNQRRLVERIRDIEIDKRWA
jgi:biopolymer transport protein ExbB/TolQ